MKLPLKSDWRFCCSNLALNRSRHFWSEPGPNQPKVGIRRRLFSNCVRKPPSLPNLKALYFGEMTYEECEISWINQSGVSPLLRAFPLLEIFRVRGGTELSFSQVSHGNLRHLAIETGGLPSSVLREVFLCDFPNLEHLELLLGEEGYGFDGSAEDLQPLAGGKGFSKA